MKLITNDSLQSLEIYFKGPTGPEIYWIKPKESVAVKSATLTDQVINLSKKRLLKIKNI